MKSCLKSPPPTPRCSVPGTPSGSGASSPGSASIHLPCMRKTVSFCQKEDGLEEIFEADDWDRTPAPVAPKLSYEDLLELKQIMQSLPRAAYNPVRLPFTSTSMPCTSSPAPPPAAAPFPIARLAASPSLTPSKWKNRGEPATIDPSILPYLDSVPIRLLPLLPTDAGDVENSSIASQAASSSSERSTTIAERRRLDSQAPAPLAPAINLVSPSAAPSSSVSSVSSLPAAAVVSPSSSPNNTPTRRRPNFSFVPLLPVHEQQKIEEPPPVPLLVQSAPQVKHFNMSFVPLLPMDDQPTTPTSSSPSIPAAASLHSETTPQKDASHPADGSHHHSHASHEEHDHGSYFPVTYNRRRRSPTSTPSLSSASDTDTESDAPSMNSPVVPASPADDDYDALTHYFASHPPFGAHAYDANAEDPARVRLPAAAALAATHNPYFPSVPAHRLPSTSTEDVDDDAALSNPPIAATTLAVGGAPVSVPIAVAPSLARKVKLEALPSPALVPPSPFSLYPPESDADDTDTEGESEKALGGVVRVAVTGLGKRMHATRPSTLSVASSLPSSASSSSSSSASSSGSSDGDGDAETDDTLDADVGGRLRMLEPSPAPSVASVSTSVSDTPMLTIEAMRDAYDDYVARKIEVSEAAAGGVLGPSLSRRE